MLAALAAVCYLPLLLTAPGRVASDTKSYLYLDPGRLLSRAVSMWDPHVGLGTVTHQNIGYLFPMGPFFWLADRAGLPDWMAQRLWLGSILFAAGAGAYALLREAGLPRVSLAVGAAAYALSPYTLTHAGKHSVVLLPFSGLPWLLLFTQRSARRGGWRWPAAFALVILAVGGVNATALVLVGIGPALWLTVALAAGHVRPAAAVGATLRIGSLTTLTSLWWMAGLWAQSRYGLDVLRFTETAQTVADASVAVEILRSLGYWFFYGRDRLSPWVSAAPLYMQRLVVVVASFAVPVAAVAGAAFARWRERAFYVALLGVGVLASVGAHPWSAPPPLGRLWRALLLTDAGLALRSTPRAVPLVALALAALLAGGVAAVQRASSPTVSGVTAAALVAAIAVAMTPLFTGAMIDATLQRDEDIPAYWREAAAALDAGRSRDGATTRVLEVPGIDFAAYRWGSTVDPITPGLIDRPYVAREVVPYGSPASADLLAAFDRRLQENVLDPSAVAPVARLMAVGTIASRNDIEYERYRAARPYAVRQVLDAAPGVGPARSFGPPRVVTENPTAPLIDELYLAQDPAAFLLAPVEARDVIDPLPIVRAKDPSSTVVLAGDGEGVVAAAAAGLIEGRELVRYSASMSAAELADLPDGARLVLTDSNRRRGRRWYTVRENAGYTEPVGVDPLVVDASDNRLDLFGPDPAGTTQTVAQYRGGVLAQATSYGNPTTLTPEYRPANAVDGDPSTVWRTGAGRDVRGERIVLTFAEPVTTDRVLLRQLAPEAANRSITEVSLTFDGETTAPLRHSLGPASQAGGEAVAFPARTFRRLAVEITADSSGRRDRPLRPARWFGMDSVGFAEIDVAGRRAGEVIRLPLDLPTGSDLPLTVLLERQRADPAERVRRDEEPSLARVWTLDRLRLFGAKGTARLSAAVPDDAVDGLVQPDRRITATSSRRLEGDLSRRASSAADGSLDTAWMPGFGAGEDWIELRSPTPVTIDTIQPVVIDRGRHSLPRQIRIDAGDGPAVAVDLPAQPAGPDGLVRHQRISLPRPLTGTVFRFTVTDVEERTTTEWFSGAPIRVPVAVVELGVPALVEAQPDPATPLPAGCRPGLLSVDGADQPLRITATVGDAVGRRTLPLQGCRPLDLGQGEHRLTATPGGASGIDIDRLALTDGAWPQAGTRGQVPTLRSSERSATRVDVTAAGARADRPFWLVLAQSNNDGWFLTADGATVGPRALVDGYANGWLVTPQRTGDLVLRLQWRPQRIVWVALGVSGLGVLLCVALVAFPPRRRAPAVIASRAAAGPAVGGGAVPWSWAVGAGLVVGAAADLAIGPGPGAVAGLATLLAARWTVALGATRLAAPGALALAAAYVVARQVRYAPEPALEWPAELAAVHQLAWSSVALLAAVVVADRLRARRVARRVEGPLGATSDAGGPAPSRVPDRRGPEPD